MTDILTRAKRSWNMSRIKSKDTKPEITLHSLLHKSGLRFRLHEKKLLGGQIFFYLVTKQQSLLMDVFGTYIKITNMRTCPKHKSSFGKKILN